jgi:cell division protein FtsL
MPFTEEQADFFFGREAEREIITANLMASRLTLFYGPSGVGKSSVLNAGVAHHLRADQTRTINGKPEFGIVTFRTWRADPLTGVEHAIAAEIGRPVSGATFLDRLQNATDAVAGDLLIILDQFEEYFLYHSAADGDGTFAVEFPRVVNRLDLRVSFLVSMREDSIAKLDFFKGRIPNLFDNYLRIDHLERSQARDAIVRPIEQFNRRLPAGALPMRIEPSLVDDVLTQVTRGRVAIAGTGKGRLGPGTSGQSDDARVETPYLQLVLTRLWQEETAAGSRELRASTLERLGGAEHIVATHLDAALAALAPEERDAAAGIFQYLVTPSGTKIALGVEDLAQYAKRKKEEIQPLLVRLSSGENRILTPVAPPPDQPSRESYQIFHDVLAAAVLEWRNRYKAAAERQQAEARAEEQRQRAEQEAHAAAHLRKQRRRLFALWTVTGILLVVVVVLGWMWLSLQREVLDLQTRAIEADARVTGLLDQARASEAVKTAALDEANRLFIEAAQLARAGQAEAAAKLEARASDAAVRAQTVKAETDNLYSTIAKEQKQASDYQKQAEDLGKNLPKGKRPTPTASADYRDTFRMAINAKNRRQWDDARDLLEQAIRQNPVESAGRLPISGSSYFEPYVPNYFLGIALKNLGDCSAALRAWAVSERQGAIRNTNLYRSLMLEKDACSRLH